MKRFMTTTAMITALTAGSAYAAGHGMEMFRAEAEAGDVHASEFIGMRVYASEAGVADDIDMFQDNWEDVGEINDIILSKDGSIEAVLVDLGGFLGIGERQVAMNMDSIKFVTDGSTEDPEDFFLVVPASRANLEEAPEYAMTAAEQTEETMEEAGQEVAEAAEATEENIEEAGDRIAEATDEAAEETADAVASAENAAENAAEETGDAVNNAVAAADEATEDAAESMENAGERLAAGTAAAGAEIEAEAEEMAADAESTFAREGYTIAAKEELTTEDLTGARVYDANDEWIGEIDKLLVSDNGQLDSAIVDVGGFLGLGEKPVQLTMDKLDILREDAGNGFVIHAKLTEEELNAMPTFED